MIPAWLRRRDRCCSQVGTSPAAIANRMNRAAFDGGSVKLQPENMLLAIGALTANTLITFQLEGARRALTHDELKECLRQLDFIQRMICELMAEYPGQERES